MPDDVQNADVGDFTLTGPAVVGKVAYPAGVTAFVLTGKAVDPVTTHRSIAEVGAFVLDGQDATPRTGKGSTCGVGEFLLTGQAVGGVDSRTPATPLTATLTPIAPSGATSGAASVNLS